MGADLLLTTLFISGLMGAVGVTLLLASVATGWLEDRKSDKNYRDWVTKYGVSGRGSPPFPAERQNPSKPSPSFVKEVSNNFDKTMYSLVDKPQQISDRKSSNELARIALDCGSADTVEELRSTISNAERHLENGRKSIESRGGKWQTDEDVRSRIDTLKRKLASLEEAQKREAEESARKRLAEYEESRRREERRRRAAAEAAEQRAKAAREATTEEKIRKANVKKSALQWEKDTKAILEKSFSKYGFTLHEFAMDKDGHMALRNVRISASREQSHFEISCHAGEGFEKWPPFTSSLLNCISIFCQIDFENAETSLRLLLKGAGHSAENTIDVSETAVSFSLDNITPGTFHYMYFSVKSDSFTTSKAPLAAQEGSCMTGVEFEAYCANLLKANEFVNVSLTPSSGDQGIDILASKDEVRYGIQCKRYASDVGNKAIQEAYAGKTFYGCHVAVVMTNSNFTKAAVEAAKHLGVVLWDKSKLSELERKATSARPAKEISAAISDTAKGEVQSRKTSDPQTPTDELIALAAKESLETIDKRDSGGCLWIIGDESRGELFKSWGKPASELKFKPGGGKATGGRDAWWVK